MTFEWVLADTVLALHREQIAEHGGVAGIRDEGLLSSALVRPKHLAHYGEPDIFDLAAAYAFGIARNHPFLDGNKRTAFVTAATFLLLNGQRFVHDEDNAVSMILRLAAGEVEEAELAGWFRDNSRAVKSG